MVVALLHGGLDAAAYSPTMENPSLYLARVPGIDALALGHQHTACFPVLSVSAGLAGISLVAPDDGSGRGTAKYAIDLSK